MDCGTFDCKLAYYNAVFFHCSFCRNLCVNSLVSFFWTVALRFTS